MREASNISSQYANHQMHGMGYSLISTPNWKIKFQQDYENEKKIKKLEEINLKLIFFTKLCIVEKFQCEYSILKFAYFDEIKISMPSLDFDNKDSNKF